MTWPSGLCPLSSPCQGRKLHHVKVSVNEVELDSVNEIELDYANEIGLDSVNAKELVT